MSERLAVFSRHCLDDIEYWVRTDRKVALRLLRIITDTLRDPFQGMGKPEPLRGSLSGLWSRRVTQEHRLVYEVTKSGVQFLQARHHY